MMQNNTIVHLTTNALAVNASGDLIPPGIILFGEPWRGRPYGAGAIFEGNIAYELEPVIQADPFPLYDPSRSFLHASHNLIQGMIWPGEGNLSSDPMFVNIGGPFTAQNIRSNLMLRAGSPCLGTGPNGIDMGALVPAGASLSGIPDAPSPDTTLTVRVAGPGIVAYRWKLNAGSWSSEIPLTNSFSFTSNYFNPTNGLVKLTGLTDGLQTIQAIGKNSAGAWQSTNEATTRTWVVETTPELRINLQDATSQRVVLTFRAEAGQTYSVLFKDSLNDAIWQKLKDVAALETSAPVVVTDDTPSSTSRFYQLVTPAQP
jgi:hypothetical protein